jgi:hypothetical protein
MFDDPFTLLIYIMDVEASAEKAKAHGEEL